MDLAGQKLRTGPVEAGEGVIKWRPRRDEFGRVRAPARIWLTAEEHPHPPPSPADACLPVPADWLGRLASATRIRFRDARKARRRLRVVDVAETGCWVQCERTAYVTAGTRMRLRGEASSGGKCQVGMLPPREQAITIQPGDTLILTKEFVPGRRL